VLIRVCLAPTLLWGMEKNKFYLGDLRTTPVQGKGKVFLKLTSRKTLALMMCYMFPLLELTLFL